MAQDSPALTPYQNLAASANHVAANPVHPTRPMSGASATARTPPRDTGPVVVRSPGQPQSPDTQQHGPAGLSIAPERLDELEKGYLRQDRFTRGMQDLADRGRALDERERLLSSNPARPTAAPQPTSIFGPDQIAKIDEEVPGLGRALDVLGNRIGEIANRQDNFDSALRESATQRTAREQEAAEDAALENSLSSREGQPYFNRAGVLQIMQEAGLGRDPSMLDQHVEIAYRTLSNYNIGRSQGAEEAARAAASAPPVMGSSPTAMGGGPAGPANHAVQTGGPMSWADKTREAMRGMGYDPDAE